MARAAAGRRAIESGEKRSISATTVRARNDAEPRSHRGVAVAQPSRNGPESFGSFDEILERTVLFNPTRSESSLRRGILHNATERPDGTWSWRYDRFTLPDGATVPDFGTFCCCASAISRFLFVCES